MRLPGHRVGEMTTLRRVPVDPAQGFHQADVEHAGDEAGVGQGFSATEKNPWLSRGQ